MPKGEGRGVGVGVEDDIGRSYLDGSGVAHPTGEAYGTVVDRIHSGSGVHAMAQRATVDSTNNILNSVRTVPVSGVVIYAMWKSELANRRSRPTLHN